MTGDSTKKGFFRKFPGQFWLVIMFEFFERGSYYGMMSFLSIYFTDTLGFAKEGVGVIKGVIQPLLYFLPILAGALADRFGYRKLLMAAFTLLGGGYFLTSQMSTFTGVFVALVIMGFGAGTFKPIISGTIAKVTDESNSTQAFGIFYWSINLGAFLFPLVLVPVLKKMDPSYVIIASGICTAAMIIPTALFFRDPSKRADAEEKILERNRVSLLQTMANAFEIIYSPIVLLCRLMKRSIAWKSAVWAILALLFAFALFGYLGNPPATGTFPSVGVQRGDITVLTAINRNMGKLNTFQFDPPGEQSPSPASLTIFKPDRLAAEMSQVLLEIRKIPPFQNATPEDIRSWMALSEKKIILRFENADSDSLNGDFQVMPESENQYVVKLRDGVVFSQIEKALMEALHQIPLLRGITLKDCRKLHDELSGRSIFLLCLTAVVMVGLLLVWGSAPRPGESSVVSASGWMKSPAVAAVFLVICALSLAPGLTLLERIICSVIVFSLLSLLMIDKSNPEKFVDHVRFLLMIVLYSGFWVLYFQMFDSVLWYVQAYVDAGVLNRFVNAIPALVGIKTHWFFDVEHVTVINAMAIILLQLFISGIVKNKKALPTMISGIAIATFGMAILALSTHIMVFLAGIIIFSVGEMTAHPKFISYVGLTAPTEKKAMYMGYIFLYGVFGSSVGAIVGARLYVHFVENLNQPRTLWLIFSCIGLATIVGLLLYNKFLAVKK